MALAANIMATALRTIYQLKALSTVAQPVNGIPSRPKRAFAYAQKQFVYTQNEFACIQKQFACIQKQFACIQKQFACTQKQFVCIQKQFVYAQKHFVYPQIKFACPQNGFAYAQNKFGYTQKEFVQAKNVFVCMMVGEIAGDGGGKLQYCARQQSTMAKSWEVSGPANHHIKYFLQFHLCYY